MRSFLVPEDLDRDALNVFPERQAKVLVKRGRLPDPPAADSEMGLTGSLSPKRIYRTEGVIQASYSDAVIETTFGAVIVRGMVAPEMVDPRFEKVRPTADIIANMARAMPPGSDDLTIGFHPRGRNYFHWTTQCLFNAFLLQKDGALATTRITVPEELGRMQTRTLELIGVGKDQQVVVDTRPVRVRRAVVTNVLYGASTVWKAPTELCEMAAAMRANAVSDARGAPAIYISRLDSPKRAMTNEKALIEALEGCGITHINMGGKSVDDQIAILSQARLIIAPHGASLTNILYARPGAILYELFAASYIHPVYELMARALGLHYTRDISHDTSGERHSTSWRCDIDKVAATARRLRGFIDAAG